MCGIFGYIGIRQDSAHIVLEGLKTLEYRGYDSWGIATINQKLDIKNKKLNSNKIIVKKNVGKIGNATVEDLPKSSMALGHTRWATHGGVTVANAHPHLDCSERFALIHNGIIENYDSLKNNLPKTHRYLSQTDTEVAIHLIEHHFNRLKKINKQTDEKKIFLEAVISTFNSFTGLNAIIAMDSVTRVFIAAKTGSPLVAGEGIHENFLSSDAHAILPYTKSVYFIEDGEVLSVDQDEIRVFDRRNLKGKAPQFITVNWQISKADKGDFNHFMEKEIYDQPNVINGIMNSQKQLIMDFASLIQRSYGTYLVGCGTAAYASLAGTYIFSKIAGKHVNFSVGSEFGYLVDFLTTKSLVIALSQSGETIDVLEAVKKAKEKGALIGTLVNVLGSSLYRFADYKFLLNAGVEMAVVSTKAFTAKLATLILIAYALQNDYKNGQKVLSNALHSLQKVLKSGYIEKIKKTCRMLSEKNHIYIIGRGLSYPVALETALKIKEASYIHAEGFAAGELKHGVIALIEKSTPCIVFAPNDETHGATIAGAMEMKARGGYIIGISYTPHEVFDEYFEVNDCGIATIIPSAVIGQLMGYHLSLNKHVDPDKPRNLAKSVTVK